MIISEKTSSSLADFSCLMQSTDNLLNHEAKAHQNYFSKRNGTQLEADVFDALRECAKKTPFEDTIVLVSGASFPDIVINNFYGVEVKSTIKNQWKSIGSSILESTRIQNVKRIFITFGKLGDPISFKSRPYEECLSGISVTHYPRYQINMELKPGETIFDKMGISYDELRKMDNPVVPVSKYYKNHLKPGESLWWAAEDESEEQAAPPIIRLWNTLTPAQKNQHTIQGYALFPEILGSGCTKYQRYALWLATHCSIIDTNIRDQFSAGGKVDIQNDYGVFTKVPATLGRIKKNAPLIEKTINEATPSTLLEYWRVASLSDNRIAQWCEIASNYTENKAQTFEILCSIFNL